MRPDMAESTRPHIGSPLFGNTAFPWEPVPLILPKLRELLLKDSSSMADLTGFRLLSAVLELL